MKIDIPNKLVVAAVAVVGAFAVGRVTAASFPNRAQAMSYAGFLADSAGNPRLTTAEDLLLEVFNQLEGGSEIVPCEARQDDVNLADSAGRFRIQLPAECVTALTNSGDAFAQLTVSGTSLPRQRIGATAYAVVADSALNADEAVNADFATQAGTVADNTIGLLQLQANAVDGSRVLDGSIGAVELADASVTQAKLAANAVGSAALVDNAVTSAKIANGAVGSAQLDANGVGTAQLANLAVTTAKIEAAFVARVATLESRPIVVSAQVEDPTDGPSSTIVSRDNDNFISGNCANLIAGRHTCTFTPGFWAAPPNCVALMSRRSLILEINSLSVTGMDVFMTPPAGGAADGDYMLMCQGIKL